MKRKYLMIRQSYHRWNVPDVNSVFYIFEKYVMMDEPSPRKFNTLSSDSCRVHTTMMCHIIDKTHIIRFIENEYNNK